MKILLVDDHVLIREALRGVLKELRGDVTIFEAGDSRQAIEIVAEQADLDFILLDLNLPDRDSFAVLSELRECYPAISVVVLSAQQDRNSVVKALDLGARGFIPKSGQRDVILGALRLVFAGGVYIPPEAIAQEEPPPPPKPTLSRFGAQTAHVTPADLGLTGRQLDVLALLMQGKGNKAICRILNLAEPTVKNHVTAILKALKVTDPGTTTTYRDNGDGTVTDNSTGLMWEKKGYESRDVHDMSYVYSWSKPENPGAGGTKKDGTAFTIFLKQLNEGPGFAYHSDWRLPTVKELLTIVHRSRSLPAIDPIFGPTQSDYYWSDDTVLEPPGHTYIAQIVNFGVLQQDPPTRPEVYTSNKVQENYVRAVRDASDSVIVRSALSRGPSRMGAPMAADQPGTGAESRWER